MIIISLIFVVPLYIDLFKKLSHMEIYSLQKSIGVCNDTEFLITTVKVSIHIN